MTRYSPYWAVLLVALLIMTGACVEPYSPPVSLDASDILVVDGFINSNANSVAVNIKHAVPLSSSQQQTPETSAIVSVEENEGGIFPLTELPNGNYRADGLSLDMNKKYRLTIKTNNGKTYQSEYITLQHTPQIDSITWTVDQDGIVLMSNTHDDTKPVGYYLWNFIETWESNAVQYSIFRYEDQAAIPRTPDEMIYTCWRSVPSTTILVGSTKQLSSNVIRNFVIQRVPKGSSKFMTRYSILVQQRELSEEAFNYWQLLQKTTENLGGLFDPLPAKVTGNISSLSDPDEPILGYFSGGSVTEKRIFINRYEIPPDYRYVTHIGDCVQDSISVEDLAVYNGPTYSMNLIASYSFDAKIAGYTYTGSPSCIDCRLSGGGTTVKPGFWE